MSISAVDLDKHNYINFITMKKGRSSVVALEIITFIRYLLYIIYFVLVVISY
jgi:hypothetical protein